MRKKIFISVMMIVFSGCKTTQVAIRTISPEQGEITFARYSIFTDKQKYNASVDALYEKSAAALKDWQLENKEPDEPALEIDVNLVKITLKQTVIDPKYNSKKKEYTHKFQDSLIVSFKKTGDRIIGDYRVINRNLKTFYYLAKKDSTTTYYNNSPYKYREEKEFFFKGIQK